MALEEELGGGLCWSCFAALVPCRSPALGYCILHLQGDKEAICLTIR